MRGITTFIVLVGLFAIGLLIAVPTLDTLAPMATEMAPGYSGQIGNIHEVLVKWMVPVFLFSMLTWAVFWILRQERQEVRR
ncbi:MAG: hypothetical protein ACNS61_16220 [Candidatus Wenzhouxiangella sp. M2_3B_020]